MRLSVFLGCWVVKFQSAETHATHEQEGDVLHLLDVLFFGVLVLEDWYENLSIKCGRTLNIFRISLLLATKFNVNMNSKNK